MPKLSLSGFQKSLMINIKETLSRIPINPKIKAYFMNKRNFLIRWCNLQWVFFRSKWVHILLFVVVNIVIGSLGVWMTILMTHVINDHSTFIPELKKILATCGPYTFAVAYLAASSSYIAYEYLDDLQTTRRKRKIVAATASFVLIILCTLLSGFQTQSQNYNIQDQHELPVVQTNLNAVNASPPKTHAVLTDSEELQLWLTGIAIILGAYLYLTSRWDDADAVQLVLNFELELKQESAELELKVNNNQPSPSTPAFAVPTL